VTSVDDNDTFDDITDDIPLLSTSDLDFRTTSGAIGTLDVWLPDDTEMVIGLVYFGVDEWERSAEYKEEFGVSSPQAISLVNDPAEFGDLQNFDDFADDFYQSVRHAITYESNLNSAEINVQHITSTDPIRILPLIGARYVRIDENFSLDTVDFPGATTANGIGRYNIQTSNNLIGVQGGLRIDTMARGSRGGLRLGSHAKAGFFANSATVNNHLFNDGVTRVQEELDGSQFAFIGELQVTAGLDLTTWATLQAGYSLLWVEGLALAPDQFNMPGVANGTSTVSSSGGVLYHGLQVSAVFRY
jgi:hypothetical protein